MLSCKADSGVREIRFGEDLGDELSALHQVCPGEGQTIRVALLDAYCKPRASHYHWHRNGFYACNTPKDGPEAPCCEVQRSWTCVCLALQYLGTRADGSLEPGAEIRYRVGYASLARSAFVEVSPLMRETPGCDLLYSKAGGSYSHRRASREPAWKSSPQARQVEAEARRWSDGAKLSSKLGRKLTDEQWVRLLRTGRVDELDED